MQVRRPNGSLKREHIFALTDALGGVGRLAEHLGVHNGNVSHWRTGYRNVPQTHLDTAKALWDEHVAEDKIKLDVPPPTHDTPPPTKAQRKKAKKPKKPRAKKKVAAPEQPRTVVTVNTVADNGTETSVVVLSDGQVIVNQTTPESRAVDKVIERSKRLRGQKSARSKDALAKGRKAVLGA